MHSTCIKHGREIRTQCIGSTFILLWRKDWSSYQTRSNAIILHETLPAYCIQKVVRMETGEVIFEKVYASPRPPPNISLKHEWKKELGSEHAQRSEVGQLSRSFPIEPTKSKSNSWENEWDPLSGMKEKRHVLRRSMLILFTKNLFLQRENGETRYWNESKPNTFIWRQ